MTRLREFNPCHEPAGSETGGRFAPKGEDNCADSLKAGTFPELTDADDRPAAWGMVAAHVESLGFASGAMVYGEEASGEVEAETRYDAARRLAEKLRGDPRIAAVLAPTAPGRPSIRQILKDNFLGLFGSSSFPEDVANDPPTEFVMSLLNDWAGSSRMPTTMMLQREVMSRFAPDATTAHFSRSGNLEDKLLPEHAVRLREAFGAVAEAIYADTQSRLKAAGVERLSVYRGTGVDAMLDPDVPITATLDMQPLSSFSLSPRAALSFTSLGGGRAFVETSIPRERVFSLGGLGMGTLWEREVVVLGGPLTARLTQPSDVWALKDRLKPLG